MGMVMVAMVTAASAQDVGYRSVDSPFQDDFEIVNARFGLMFYDWNADLTFWGRNITDERYHVGSFDAPIQVGRMNAYPAEPSTFGVTFRKGFD